MELSNNAWQLLFSKASGVNNSRNVFVLKQHHSKWEDLKNDHEGKYYLTTILRAIYSLNALAGGRSPKTKPLPLRGAKIHYEIDIHGDVRIHGLEIDSALSPQGGQQATGLYNVKYEHKEWKTKEIPQHTMELNHKWSNAHYAAVSGKFDDKESAGEELVNHIHEAYKTNIRKKDSHQASNHYSLYWQNGRHNDSDNVASLTSLIQQAQSRKARVNWLIHGEGAGTFVQALQTLKSHPSLSRIEAQDGEIVRNLREVNSLQSVYFSNPRGKGTTKNELEKWCQEVGITYAGLNPNPYDLRNRDNLQKVFNKGVSLGAVAYIAGAEAALSLSTTFKSWGLAISADAVTTAGCFLLATYVVGKDASSTLSGYARSLPNSWKSTAGKGNQNWAAA
ncbi:MAG: hypothetical protein ACRBBW_14110 [Cellvibrionaceae bacterium]